MSAVPANRKCKVYLLHGTLSEGEMAGLYRNKSIAAYVTSTHGEGFGLPAFDAARSGLPIVAANWGGLQEYSSVEGVPMILEVAHEIDNVKDYQQWTGVLETTAKWCFPDTVSLRAKMREAHSESKAVRKNALLLPVSYTHLTLPTKA